MSDSCHAPRRYRECRYWWFDGWDWLVNRVLSLLGTPRVELNTGEVAIDLHIHTLYSHCSISQPKQILLWAARLGLSGVGIMDHHQVKGAIETIKCAEDLKHRGLLKEEFLVIPGVELNSTVGHIGALFVDKDLPEGLPPERTVDAIHEVGGLAVAVHPYHSTGIGNAIFDAPFDAVEVECGSVFDRKLVRLNRNLASDPRLSSACKLGTSDAHYTNAIASCYSVLKIDEHSLDAVKRSMLSGNCVPKSSDSLHRIRKLLGLIPKLR